MMKKKKYKTNTKGSSMRVRIDPMVADLFDKLCSDSKVTKSQMLRNLINGALEKQGMIQKNEPGTIIYQDGNDFYTIKGLHENRH